MTGDITPRRRRAEQPPQTRPEPRRPGFLARQPRPARVLLCVLLCVAALLATVTGFVCGRELLDRHRYKLEEAQYRLLYRDLIEDYAAEQTLDPALVAAVIYNESRFDPGAVSRVGARGLMQIMPDTAEWLAHKLSEEDGYSFERMFDAETNIRFGCWYLGYLSRSFGGDPVKIAASYHAGQNAVSSWLNDPLIAPDGWTLAVQNIPYPDTRQYVERVVKAYAIYQKHYYAPQAG